MNAATTTTVTITVTQEHIDKGRAGDMHPVALAILAALPHFQDADIIVTGAVGWDDGMPVALRFDAEGQGFVLACDYGEDVKPFSFTATVIP